MLGCGPCETPIDLNHPLQENEGGRVIDISQYYRLVGMLIYLSLARTNISFALELSVSLCMLPPPTTKHLVIAYCIVQYLKKSPGNGLLYMLNSMISASKPLLM